jgi:hypothetical protein
MRHWMIALLLLCSPVFAQKKNPETPPLPVTICAANITVDGQMVQPTLVDWRRAQAQKLGPPAPLWISWRLRQLPTALYEAASAGCEPIKLPATTIKVTDLQPGLWQIITLVTPEALTEDPRLLLAAGWRTFEVKTGQTEVAATVRLKPTTSLDIRLNLDSRPTDFDQVSVCLFDEDGLVDLLVVSMTTQSVRMKRVTAPVGKIEVVALVLSDPAPSRRGLAEGMIANETIVVNITRPLPPKEPPTASSTNEI